MFTKHFVSKGLCLINVYHIVQIYVLLCNKIPHKIHNPFFPKTVLAVMANCKTINFSEYASFLQIITEL